MLALQVTTRNNGGIAARSALCANFGAEMQINYKGATDMDEPEAKRFRGLRTTDTAVFVICVLAPAAARAFRRVRGMPAHSVEHMLFLCGAKPGRERQSPRERSLLDTTTPTEASWITTSTPSSKTRRWGRRRVATASVSE
jgi:hypothetical protein